MTFDDAVEKACEQGDFTNALVFISIWEMERIIGPVRKELGEWESCFEHCFDSVIERWFEKKFHEGLHPPGANDPKPDAGDTLGKSGEGQTGLAYPDILRPKER